MYNSALVMPQQLQAVGINAQLKVVDWPTSVQMSLKADTGWNFFFTGWGTQPALGALDTMAFLVPPIADYMPKDGKPDPDLAGGVERHEHAADRRRRGRTPSRAMQKLVLDQVYALPFGSLTKVQAVRANVQGFKPFRIPRMSNVWFAQLTPDADVIGIVLRRLASAIPILLIVSLITFGMMHMIPGDPAAAIAGLSATPEQIASSATISAWTSRCCVQLVHWYGGAAAWRSRPLAADGPAGGAGDVRAAAGDAGAVGLCAGADAAVRR